QVRGASRPSFAGSDDRSGRPARKRVDQYRRGSLFAGNASFPAPAQVAPATARPAGVGGAVSPAPPRPAAAGLKNRGSGGHPQPRRPTLTRYGDTDRD